MINDEGLNNLERLHKLKADGIITEADFETAKAKLLAQVPVATRVAKPTAQRSLSAFDGQLPAEDDHIGWMLLPLKRYADFNGRSTRREFWMFQLAITAALLAAAIIAYIIPAMGILLMAVIVLGALVPVIAVEVRRFHDQDKSGWFALLNLIPYLGPLIILVFMYIDGTQGDNQFGPDPKER